MLRDPGLVVVWLQLEPRRGDLVLILGGLALKALFAQKLWVIAVRQERIAHLFKSYDGGV